MGDVPATFWVAAGLLLLLAMAIVATPFLRRGVLPFGVGATLAGLALATLLLYSQVSTWDWGYRAPETPASASAPDVESMVAGLAERLTEDPNDVEGWTMLARSYVVMGRFSEAARAIEEAWQRTPEPDVALKLAYAETQTLADNAWLDSDEAQMLDAVVKADPTNARALWYGGMYSARQGNWESAKLRWQMLLQLNPPPNVAAVLEQRLAELDSMAAPSADSGQSTAVAVDVSLAENVPNDLTGVLFLIARDPRGGPPVAVSRHALGAVPGKLSLSDDNAMMPGRTLSQFTELEIVARISQSGQAAAQPGDWYGRADYRADMTDTQIALVIDQQVN